MSVLSIILRDSKFRLFNQITKKSFEPHFLNCFSFLGYSRNQTAPMSPRSYSAYSNAYGSSAASYGVPSPGFLNG
jgi:hypothetical protein